MCEGRFVESLKKKKEEANFSSSFDEREHLKRCLLMRFFGNKRNYRPRSWTWSSLLKRTVDVSSKEYIPSLLSSLLSSRLELERDEITFSFLSSSFSSSRLRTATSSDTSCLRSQTRSSMREREKAEAASENGKRSTKAEEKKLQ